MLGGLTQLTGLQQGAWRERHQSRRPGGAEEGLEGASGQAGGHSTGRVGRTVEYRRRSPCS
jgi:hypothetical protein